MFAGRRVPKVLQSLARDSAEMGNVRISDFHGFPLSHLPRLYLIFLSESAFVFLAILPFPPDVYICVNSPAACFFPTFLIGSFAFLPFYFDSESKFLLYVDPANSAGLERINGESRYVTLRTSYCLIFYADGISAVFLMLRLGGHVEQLPFFSLPPSFLPLPSLLIFS